MARRLTEIASPYGREAPPAAGLHDPDRARTYLFSEFKARFGRQRRRLVVGRAPYCDIRVRDAYASSEHFEIECRRDGMVVVRDLESTNGLYVDGRLVRRPFYLAEGMRLRLGDAHLYAVDDRRRFPITAKTVADFLRGSARVYGNNTLAGERIGVSRESIRRRVMGPFGDMK